MEKPISKSGVFRQLISATSERLSNYLSEVEKHDFKFAVDPDASADNNLHRLEDMAYTLQNMLKRITNAVGLLHEQNQKWGVLQQSLEEAELKSEVELYEQWTKDDKSFIKLMSHGMEAIDMLESRLLELKDTINRLRAVASTNQTSQSLPPISFGQSSPSPGSDPYKAIKVQLPKLQLPFYHGDPLKWTEFWDAFEAAVHTQVIPNVQKFNYLISMLKDSAYKAIEGLAVTNANYPGAVDILKRRFGDTNIIKRALYAELRSIPVSTGKTTDLRKTLEAVDRICRQLESMGEDLNQPTLLMMIQEKLPTHILVELGKLKRPEDMWQVSKLREELDNNIRIKEEAFQLGQSNNENRTFRGNPQRPLHQNHGQPKFSSSADAFSTFVDETSRRNTNPSKGPGGTKKIGLSPCAFCGGNHFHEQCTNCKTVEERKQKVQELKLCFRCLKNGHISSQCRFIRPCVYCKGSHNRALCSQRNNRPTNQTETSVNVQSSETVLSIHTESIIKSAKENEVTTDTDTDRGSSDEKIQSLSMATLQRKETCVSLLTAKVRIRNPRSQTEGVDAYVFFDSGSQRSFITAELSQRLSLRSFGNQVLSVNTFASTKPQEIKTLCVSFIIMQKDGYEKEVQANTVPVISNAIKIAPIEPEDLLEIHKLSSTELADDIAPNGKAIKPDILIGGDFFWDFIKLADTKRLPSGLHLIQSSVGIMITGKQDIQDISSTICCNIGANIVLMQTDHEIILPPGDEKMHNELPKDCAEFWNLETIGIRDCPEVNDDDLALQQFNNNVKFKDGRYEVRWPWKSENPEIPDNFGLAFGRLKSLSRRFQQDPNLLQKYNEVIQDQLSKGIIEKIDNSTATGPHKHYLPHHPVITPQKTATKVRIVYDASAKGRKDANSLNDCLYRGPILLPDLCGVLLRFRMYQYAITADVEKAFLQLNLQVADRDVTRFLWFSDPTKPEVDGNVQIYRFCRVPFGVISSPFLLNATLKYHLTQENTESALQAASNLYVDNAILGAKSPEDAIKVFKESKATFAKASMNLREWACNSKTFQESIPVEDRQMDPVTKVLGIPWDTSTDTLRFQIKIKKDEAKNDNLTKRKVLHQLASTFDPLGFLSPILLNGKLFFQQLWKEKLEWDEPLPDNLVLCWKSITNDWMSNSTFFLNRAVPHAFSDENVYELITFVDASKSAYATVVYLKTSCRGQSSTHILFAKNRLSPNKEITLPRMELLAAVIGVRAMRFVEKEIGVPISNKWLFTDSECVLHWLKSTKPLGTFVNNRILELRKHPDIQFRYVPTDENSADVCTRGISASELVDFEQWWYGPTWITNESEYWPKGLIAEIKSSSTWEEEAINHETMCPSLVNISKLEPCLDLSRMSSLTKAKRIVVYILRFIKLKIWNKLKTKPSNIYIFDQIQDEGFIDVFEMAFALKFLIKQEQRQRYPEIFKEGKVEKQPKVVNQLGVQLDKDGILRCFGRLKYCQLQEDTKYPMLIPRKSFLTNLIILDCHQSVMHAGTNQTLSVVRQHFWIPKGRTEVKRVLNQQCFICRRYKVGPYKLPKMPPFPKERVERAQPFQFTGLDYMGPMNIKDGINIVKVWICLFTCFVTRAVHLEIVNNMSSQTFLNCIRRFIARRGKPEKIISDNAAQFKLTKKVMENAWENVFSEPSTFKYFANQKIQWQFITQYAPWQGGFYERLIGVVKQCLRKAIGRKLLSYEELCTLLPEVEAVVNSRPLTFIEEQPNQGNILRPVDFLLPHGKLGLPNIEEDHKDPEWFQRLDSEKALLCYWRSSLETLDKFWKLWHEDYLLSLRERMQILHKGPRIHSTVEPKLGEIVLVKDENLSRGLWKMARISQVNVSSDDNIRSAQIQMPNGSIVQRPINVLFPLEIFAEEEKLLNDSATDNRKEETELLVFSSLFNNFAQVRLRLPALSTVLLLLCLIVSTVQGTEENYKHICPTNQPLITVHSQQCLSAGLVIKKMENDNLCWMKVTCPSGHLLSNGTCGQSCACPNWTKTCSFYTSPNLTSTGDINRILTLESPSFCSVQPDKNCDDQLIHTMMNQIQLFNGSVYFVKNLQLVHKFPTNEAAVCVGEGPRVGSPRFCKDSQCASVGTKFCYYQGHELALFVNENGEFPIKAWGAIPFSYFGPKLQQSESTDCRSCKINCTQGGIQLALQNVGTVEVCSSPYCYKITHPRTTEIVQFPKDIVIHQHSFAVKVWSNGYLIKHMEIQCPASPYCEMINCYFCLDMVGNPQCAPKAAMMVFFIMLYFITGSIYLMLRLSRTICQFCFYGTYIIYRLLKFCKSLIKRTGSKALKKFQWRQKPDEGEELRPEIKVEKENQKNILSTQSRFTYQPLAKSYHLAVVITILSFIILHVNGCAEVTTLTAQKSTCTMHQNGAMDCILTEVTRIALMPQGQDSCLLVKDPNGIPLGTLSVEVEKITIACQAKNEYFTRSFNMKVHSSKRCPSTGSCSGEKCGAITANSKVEELGSEVNNLPGFTYCTESCGCWGCGCFICSSGCLFFRSYAKPATDTIYEVFSCPVWEYNVKVNIRINLQGETRQQSFEMRPGIPSEWKNIKISLVSVSNPLVPILGSQFLTDGVRTVMVRASASGQPISNTIGALQCASKEKAKLFDCYLPHDSCVCHSRETYMACHCGEMLLEPIFSRMENVIPLTMQGISIVGSGNNIEAEYNNIASLELQVSMEGFRLSTKVEKNLCTIKPLGFGGCYSCLTGAKLQFQCNTDFGEAIAHVSCGLGSFSTICTPDGLKATATMSFPTAVVKETCQVSCPAGKTTFGIETTLVFIEKEMLGNLTNVIAAPNSAGSIDLGFLTGWLSGNWIMTIIIIIGVIILVPITLICLPIFFQIIFKTAMGISGSLNRRLFRRFPSATRSKTV